MVRPMSIWTRITEALSALTAGEGLSAVFDRLRTPPERSVGFAIAVIALSAKMAKADGRVTRSEVMAFREVFHIAPEFNLARQDVAGFDVYARRIQSMFRDQPETLYDLMEGLFHIAMADGLYHEAEAAFLEQVAEIFELPPARFAALRARAVPNQKCDPYTVLGVECGADLATTRAAWRKLVRENHPDVLMSRGLPEEAIGMAQKRLIEINRAWDEIQETTTSGAA